MNWIIGRNGWLVPLVAALLVLLGTVYLDRQLVKELAAERRQANADAEQRAGAIADEIGNTVAKRIGALTAAKIPFTQLQDSASQRSFMVAVDSVTRNLQGLNAISIVDPETKRVLQGPGALLGRYGFTLETDTALANAFERARQSRVESATGVIEFPNGRRVVIFEPVIRGDTLLGQIAGIVAAELDPTLIVRSAISSSDDSLGAVPFLVFSPNGVRINSGVVPRGWATVDRPIKVADTNWTLRVGYLPVDAGVFRVQRIATWVAGLIIALALGATLMILRQTIRTQREEIALRRAAEEDARRSADEARQRAREARELAVQLEAAQRASQQLSTSLDPDDVVELFLGGVAEALGADMASLYTFEEEGELIVGRRRMIFREAAPIVERLRGEDIRQVRAPVALLPNLAEAVATGEPFIVSEAPAGLSRPFGAGSSVASDAPQASVTIPLLIGGHMVGVASWEVYGEARSFEPGTIAFAQALAAPAAAALRTAELFASLESARERAAREALRFGTVLDQMADGVAVVDAYGQVERYNKAAEEMLGPEIATRAISEWTARLGITTVDGRPYAPGDFPLLRALRGEKVRRAGFIARSSWGGERYLSCSAAPIQAENGEMTGAAIVFRDVTDEHQYAEILRHTNRELRQQAEMLEEVNRQLREATKAKDQFLAVMSHELRTPINAIMGYSDLLDLGVKGDLTQEQRAMVNRVRETSRHLLGLINEVLDLAKIGAGRVDLVLVELEVPPIVERCVQQILPLAAAKGLSVTVEGGQGPNGENIRVLADDTRLAQILINLLSNAVKFTHEGGVHVAYEQSEDVVQIRVRDTGVGIEPDQVDRIFEEFYQVESGFSRSSGGTGLGLAIARRFTRMMGGDIRVRSNIGGGSEFVVELPSAHAQAQPEDERGELKVVLLTQDETARDTLGAALDGKARVSTAAEPPRLAALTRRMHPDLVAIDSRVPDHGPWRALAVLQSDRSTASVRTVLLVYDAQGDDRAAPLGPFVTLAKPLELESAVPTLQRLAADRDGPVLVADDDPDIVRILRDALSAGAVDDIMSVSTGTELLRKLEESAPAVLVVDLLMPGLDAINILARIRAEPALGRTAVALLAPRELSVAEMERLTRSIDAASRNEELEFVPVPAIMEALLNGGFTGGAPGTPPTTRTTRAGTGTKRSKETS